MKEWTREERYRTILEASNEELTELRDIVNSCPYRQKFHIQPTTGLLNDPNGFSYYNNEYHLFYQWFPLGPVHGVKHWYHVSSKDLVNWKDCGVGIIPTEHFESHGAFSGSGIAEDDKLYLFYTGNTRNKEWVRNPYQCLAIMDKEGKITKNNEAIIKDVPKEYTDNFRDPKVFKDNNKYYCLIGAERKENLGTIVYYESDNLKDWTFKGEIKTSFFGNGFMWECPDYLKFDDKGVLIFSPQGLKAEGDKYKNIFQSGYLIGENIDFSNGKFKHGEFTELDRGFDFYAPQVFKDHKGRNILIGWMGMPESDYNNDKTVKNGWQHALSLPRELYVTEEGKLAQKPLEELKKLRTNEKKMEFNNELSVSTSIWFEIHVDFEVSRDFVLKLRESAELRYEEGILTLDITSCGSGRKHRGIAIKTIEDIRIFSDSSSLEIFVNRGEVVFTTRIYDSMEELSCELKGEYLS